MPSAGASGDEDEFEVEKEEVQGTGRDAMLDSFGTECVLFM